MLTTTVLAGLPLFIIADNAFTGNVSPFKPVGATGVESFLGNTKPSDNLEVTFSQLLPISSLFLFTFSSYIYKIN
jgi:hypothetical protein